MKQRHVATAVAYSARALTAATDQATPSVEDTSPAGTFSPFTVIAGRLNAHQERLSTNPRTTAIDIAWLWSRPREYGKEGLCRRQPRNVLTHRAIVK